MYLKDRQKMCTQCEGRIPFDADLCPYCAADPAKGVASAAADPHRLLQESLTAPAYTTRTIPSLKITLTNPERESMVEKRFNTAPSPSMGIPTIPVSSSEEVVLKESKSVFFPILLLSIAGNLLTIGLLQLLFSERGFLRLEWDSSYWFLYCLGALPLFYLGLKKAGSLKDY